MTYLFWAAALAYVLSLYLIRWVLLLKSREPTSSIAWILLIIALPVLGGLLFLVFGINRVERKAVGMKRQTRRVLGPNLPQLAQFPNLPYQLLPLRPQHRLLRLVLPHQLPSLRNLRHPPQSHSARRIRKTTQLALVGRLQVAIMRSARTDRSQSLVLLRKRVLWGTSEM